MTREELRKVVAICSSADGGCPVCTEDLYKQLVSAFPEWRKELVEDIKAIEEE